MDKKNIAIILILILIIACIGFVAFNSTRNAKVGSSQVNIPNGYKINNTTKYSTILKSKNTTININEKHDNKTIDKIFEDYKKKHENLTVNESSKKIGNTNLRSITLINSSDNKIIHINYYYEKNNKIYHIIMKGKPDNKALEQIVKTTNKHYSSILMFFPIFFLCK